MLRSTSIGSTANARRSPLAIVWLLGWLFLLVYAASVTTGLGGEPLRVVSLMLTFVAVASGSVEGVVRSRGARLPWALLAAATISFTGTSTVYALVPDAAESFPSVYDAGLFAFYPLAIAALVMWLRKRVARVRPVVWLDVAVGAALLPAIAAAALAPSLGDNPPLGILGQLFYALGDFGLLGFLVAAYVLTERRPGHSLRLLMAGSAAIAVGDSLYVIAVAEGVTSPGPVTAVMWPLGLLLFSAAGWQPVSVSPPRQAPWLTVVIPTASAVVSIPLVLLTAPGSPGNALAGLATVLVVVRLVISVLENAKLLRSANRATVENQQALDRTKAILDSAGDGIYGIDEKGRITFVNPVAAWLTGYPDEELVGRDAHAALHHSRPDGSPYPAEDCPVMEAISRGIRRESGREEVYWRKDGTSFPVEWTSTPLSDQGTVTGGVVVFKDVTERRELERMKDEFTSVVSHELRTPLTSIRGSLGLLASGRLGDLPEKGQRMVDIAVSNTDRLVRLINDILDIERMESGRVTMDKGPCDAADILTSASEAMQSLASDAGVSLEVAAEEGHTWADQDRVMQTITNLMSNAIKFSPEGGTVRASSERRNGELLFQVRDEGRGIPADQLESIFHRFQQVDASDSREKGGTGLGLSICRTIVEQHGGRIWAESVLGEGSTFCFTLPAMAEQPVAAAPGESDGRPTVLVCDDDTSVLEVLEAVLAEQGYRTVAAQSGEEALRSAVSERPDVVLLDLLMPGMDGWDTAAALKDQAATRHIPIVILSVLAAAEADRVEADVVEWLEKPLREGALMGAIEKAIHAPQQEPSRVLLVEDDDDLASVLSTMFEGHGLETARAATGAQAIELSQRVMPDLLVLDVGLPDSDGFAVVDWLRHHDRLQALPIIVYTGRDLDEAARERLRLTNATVFLSKARLSPEAFEDRFLELLAHMTNSRKEVVSNGAEAGPGGR